MTIGMTTGLQTYANYLAAHWLTVYQWSLNEFEGTRKGRQNSTVSNNCGANDTDNLCQGCYIWYSEATGRPGPSSLYQM